MNPYIRTALILLAASVAVSCSQKWEETSKDGYNLITQEGGQALGYSPASGVQIITKGGPGTATYTLGLYIYRSAFQTYRTGYAAALSWLLCLLIMLFTVIRWRREKNYANE